MLRSIKEVVHSLGIVFGDIGTSPLYTLAAVFLIITDKSAETAIGVVSLIIWTLFFIVTIQYAWLAMSLSSRRGEGGTIVLKELLVRWIKKGRGVAFVTFLSFIGVSLLIGDGVITPAISILSAVEGIKLIPGFEHVGHHTLISIAGIIAIILFSFQKTGTEKVASAFGPIMILWFLTLSLFGIFSLSKTPFVFKAINPYYAISFFIHNKLTAFLVLSEVILCATGGEALYADMGHLGRKPIQRAWFFVYISLILCYLGQAAFVIRTPEAKNVFFEMMYSESKTLYIPILILSVVATVIASQAMISGMFSIIYQGITTRIIPLLKVDFTSAKHESQIYIGVVNWMLLAAVLFVMLIFKESSKLSVAYGLAVTGTMTLTGIMMLWLFYARKQYLKFTFAALVTIIDIAFLLANLTKLPHGGYWSLVLASVPFLLIILYTKGQRKLYFALRPMKGDEFLEKFKNLYLNAKKIEGTSLYFVKDAKEVPPYIYRSIISNQIIYEDNVFISIARNRFPYGISGKVKEQISDGLRLFEIQAGYLEIIDVETILQQHGIDAKAIFYGIEDIETESFVWSVFSAIKKLTPSFVKFYKLPPDKLHGVVSRFEL